MSSNAFLFFLLCTVASVVGESSSELEEAIAQNELRCKAELCAAVTTLKGAVTTIASNIEKQADDLTELKNTVKNITSAKLDMYTSALYNIVAPTGSKTDRSEIKSGVQENQCCKVVIMQLEEQAHANQVQTEAIDGLSVRINDLSKVLETLTILVNTVSSELQQHSKDLLGHDNNLTVHDKWQREQDEQLKDIYRDLSKPLDCRDILDRGNTASGVYHIYPGGLYPADVYCDTLTPGGPWLVFQRRKDGSVNFERSWKEYSDGFGSPSGELWLGNENLYLLTNQRKYKLRIDLEDFEKQKRYAEYSFFTIGSRVTNYRLSVSGYSGDAGNNLQGFHNGMQFSTKDADHDTNGGSCAQKYRGAWWYASCHSSNLNGLYHKSPSAPYAIGVTWSSFHGQYYSLKAVEMKIALVK